MKRLVGLLFVTTALGTTLFASAADAQRTPNPVSGATWAFQVEKPFLPDADGLAFYSTIWEADGLFALGSGKTLQVGLPLSTGGGDGIDGTSLFLGNLRVAILFGEPGDLSGYFGLTLPTASNVAGPDLALLIMALPWLDEPEKWNEDTFALRGAWTPARSLDSGGRLGLRLGGSAVFPNDLDNLYLFARMAGWASIPVGDGSLRGDLATSYVINGDDGFGDQVTGYLAIEGRLDDRAGQPALFVRLPLFGDARDALDLSIGISLIY